MSRKHWLGMFVAALVFVCVPQSEARADCSDVCAECGTMKMGPGVRSGPNQVFAKCIESPICAMCGLPPIIIEMSGKARQMESGSDIARSLRGARGKSSSRSCKSIADGF